MDRKMQEQYAEARRVVVEMNRQAWQRWLRRRTEAEVNAEVLEALNRLEQNGYAVSPNKKEIAKIRAENYAGIGSQPGDPDGMPQPQPAANSEAQKRADAAYLLVKAQMRQEWLATGVTEAAYDEDSRCLDALDLLAGYGYEALWTEPEEPAAPPRLPITAKELVPQN